MENDFKQLYRDFLIENVLYSQKQINEQKNKSYNPSQNYKHYTYTAIGLLLGGLISCFTILLLPIGVILIISAIVMFIFMPSELKEEAMHLKEINNQIVDQVNNDADNYSAIVNNYFTDTQVKRLLMDKFLSIFGDFMWTKSHSFLDISNMIILPDKLSLDTDDCIKGKYSNVKIALTEVYFGFDSIRRMISKHSKLLGKLTALVFITGFIMFAFNSVFSNNPDIKSKITISYFIFFISVWSLGFFSPLIYLVGYLLNKNSRGLIIEIAMPKSFEGETVIFENSPSNFVVNRTKLKNFSRTELEDVEFNNKYLTYTTNQVEARYILTTAFIERLKDIKFAFNAKYLRMLFRNNSITIFAEVNKDLFLMVKDDKVDKEVFDKLFEEIYSVLSLVDELKLNIKTGL